MTIEKLIEFGIAAKASKGIFVYHVFGYVLNITYYDASRKMMFTCAAEGKIYREETFDFNMTFEEFIAISRKFAAEMYEKGGSVPRMGSSMLN